MAMPRQLTDPFPGFNFQVSLIDTSSNFATALSGVSFVAGGSFSECSGLEGTLQVEDVVEGGENRFIHHFATRMTYSNIVLRHGVTLSEDLWNWHFAYTSGKGKRRDGLIVLKSEIGAPVKMWIFHRGMPLKWTGPSFNAAQSAVAIEALEIVHEGLELVSPGAAASQVGQAIASKF